MGASCCGGKEEEKTPTVEIKTVLPRRFSDDTGDPEQVFSSYEEHVEEIWRKYDSDNNGTLEKDEAYAFLKDIL